MIVVSVQFVSKMTVDGGKQVAWSGSLNQLIVSPRACLNVRYLTEQPFLLAFPWH